MAGLVPAIHAVLSQRRFMVRANCPRWWQRFSATQSVAARRRGWPGQARPWRVGEI